jgi:methyl-accepting chemotaxis protein
VTEDKAAINIRRSVEAVFSGVTRVVEAVDSIDTMSRRTSENTQTISAATEEQSASNEEIAAASQSLAKLASEMQDAIHEFKL